MTKGSPDSSFEKFAKDRRFRRAQASEGFQPQGKNYQVMRAIEAAEANEVRDQRLSRDVQSFFEDATRVAATMVQKYAERKQTEEGQKIRDEMERFLYESIQRAQSFIVALQSAEGPEAEMNLEVHMRNLVGPLLDSFRHEGNAQVPDKHIGLDPFQVEDPAPPAEEVKPIEEHIVAQAAAERTVAGPSEAKSGKGKKAKSREDALDEAAEDPEKLKDALRVLVRNGLMSREEAQQAYRQRMAGRSPSGGTKPGARS
ncbi:MAG: hypothetical protein IT458_11305 [Planctomycetes bacterium]|nr:hypothetical protein [Planctomycetota bacterium]